MTITGDPDNLLSFARRALLNTNVGYLTSKQKIE